MLGPTHSLFIEVILKISWINRAPEVTACYKKFILDLMCMHIYHSKLVINKLVFQFRSSE